MTMWLCLHLPHCALEALSRYLAADGAPKAIAEKHHGRRRIAAADTAARQQGVVPGQWLTAARAHAPELIAWERDPWAEAALQQRLAMRCLRYTSHVHLPEPPPETGAGRLLLEVGGSLRLFGGLAALIRDLHDELAGTGLTCVSAVGRTPCLAMLRARARLYGRTGSKIRALPLTLLELSQATCDSLRAAGLGTIGEVLDLPRSALSRRYGRACLETLDRLTGKRADPRPAFTPPQRFSAALELPADAEDTQALRFPLHRLIDDLAATLRGADAAIAQLRLTLGHPEAPPTRIALGFAAPARAATRIGGLLRERLETLQLPAPVRSVRLATGRFLASVPVQPSLFEEPNRDPAAWHELLDRLRARLGDSALAQPRCHADHRPERASRAAAVGAPVTGEVPASQRPTWLLSAPQPLSRPPMLLSGPERIETGWWENDQRRDYYTATEASGRQIWIYREVRPPYRWFVHGVFA